VIFLPLVTFKTPYQLAIVSLSGVQALIPDSFPQGEGLEIKARTRIHQYAIDILQELTRNIRKNREKKNFDNI
jgi:hypothetical protein